MVPASPRSMEIPSAPIALRVPCICRSATRSFDQEISKQGWKSRSGGSQVKRRRQVAIRIRKQLKRRPRSNRAGAVGRSTLATGAIAMVAMVVVGGTAFARPVGPTGKPVSAQEWTEAEKYGFGDAGDSVASRAEEFVNNYYGFGDAVD